MYCSFQKIATNKNLQNKILRKSTMEWIIKTFNSSIGKKLIVGLTGAFLVTFLLVHLSGNLLLLIDDGGEAFLQFVAFMTSNPLIKIMEFGLALGFLLHIITALSLAWHNKKSRPKNYHVNAANKNSSWSSRNMAITGSMVLLFLILHIDGFYVEHKIRHAEGTMYDTVIATFQDPVFAGLYILFMFFLALHLSHGFKSAFQTLGLRHKKYTPIINVLGWLYAVLVPLGFAMIPIVIYAKQFI